MTYGEFTDYQYNFTNLVAELRQGVHDHAGGPRAFGVGA